jgi:hypothetical protein
MQRVCIGEPVGEGEGKGVSAFFLAGRMDEEMNVNVMAPTELE